MAASLSSPPQALQSGPLVNSRSTSLTFLDSVSLSSSPLLPSIVALVNAAYATGDTTGVLPPDYVRLSGPEELLSELGSNGRLLVLSFDKSADEESGHGLIGTGTCQPALAHEDEERVAMVSGLSPVDAKFIRHGEAAKPVPGVSDWDLKLMAVSPEHKGRGIGSEVLQALERYIVDKEVTEDGAAAGYASETTSVRWRIRIRITTRAELNERFYTARGFEPVGRAEIPAGREGIGAMNPCHIVHMDKWLA